MGSATMAEKCGILTINGENIGKTLIAEGSGNRTPQHGRHSCGRAPGRVHFELRKPATPSLPNQPRGADLDERWTAQHLGALAKRDLTLSNRRQRCSPASTR